MVVPARRSSYRCSRHFLWKASSPTAITSSMRRISGATCTATANPRRTYIPLDKIFTGASMKSPMSLNSMIPSTARFISFRLKPRIAPLRYMFSLPLSSGWNPEPSSRSADTRPLTVRCPLVGSWIPAISLSSVVLPDPLCPMRPKNDPRFISRETSFNAQKSRMVRFLPRRTTASFREPGRSR